MILRLVISAYLFGLLVFLTMAIFGTPIWDYAYYMWDKTVGAGFLVWYLIYKSVAKDRKIVAPIMWFSFIRFVWEVVSLSFSIHINNKWVISLLFIILIFITGYLCFRADSRMAKFLNKNAP